MTVINRADWQGAPFPADLVSALIAKGLEEAVFFSNITQIRSSSGVVQFPLVSPTGFTWTPAGGLIPSVDPGDDLFVSTAAKIAGIIGIQNEQLADEAFDLFGAVGQAIAAGMAAKADKDLLTTDSGNPAAPVGILSSLTAADGASLREAVIVGMQGIYENGGKPDKVFLSPAHWSAEAGREAASGPITGATLFSDLGLQAIVCPSLPAAESLLIDSRYVYAVTREGSSIEVNDRDSQSWEYDLTSLRVKARVAVAVPVPAKSARKVTVTTTP